jgi:hypothetical protein
VNLILSQLKLHRRNLDGEDDAQELKPHLDLGQMIEVGRRFTAFAISSETKLNENVLFLSMEVSTV